jgi:hypothetical protein
VSRVKNISSDMSDQTFLVYLSGADRRLRRIPTGKRTGGKALNCITGDNAFKTPSISAPKNDVGANHIPAFRRELAAALIAGMSIWPMMFFRQTASETA